MLGSPAWETKIRARVYTAVQRQRQDSSVVYQHSSPPLPRPPKPIRSKQDILQHISSSECRDRYYPLVRLSNACALKFPDGLEKAQDLPRVRLPFPSQGRKRTLSFELSDVDTAIKQRHTSSGGAIKRISSRQPKTCENGWQNEPPLRLTDAPDRSMVSLSSFRVTSDSSFPLFRSNHFPPVCQTKSSPKSSANFTPQSTATRVLLPSTTNVSSSSLLLSPVPAIYRSYPLSISNKLAVIPDPKGLPKDGIYTNSRDSCLYLEILSILKPLDICTEPSPPPLDTPPVTGSSINPMHGYVSVRKASSLEISPPLHSVSPSTLPLNSKLVVSPLVKIKNTQARKVVPARPRRPSSVGPSPLRAMILPDASSTSDTSSVGSTKQRNTSNANFFSKSHRILRSLPSTTNIIFDDFRSRSFGYDEFGTFSRMPYCEMPLQTRRKFQDSEAVQASMNAKRASLIMSNVVCTSTPSRSSLISLECSKQVDPGLIGLDRFGLRDGEGHFAGVEGNSGKVDDNEIDFVSFWEEAKLLEEDDERYVSSFDWIYYRFFMES